jgi:sporulation protein YlmC with PRC-barrel domain
MIACGQCHGLEHASRHLRRQTPGVGRVERLRRKLGGCDVRPFAPLPARRRGRSRAYHEKLVAMILAEEAKLIGHLGDVVHDPMDQQHRDLIVHKPERRIADDHGCTVEEVHAVLDRHPIEVDRDKYLKRALAMQ